MDTIKLLEENICKKTSFYNSIIFLDQSPKAKWIKANISKIFLIKVLKLFAKQRKAWTEWKKTTYRMGENICQWCDWQGFNI